MPPVIVAMSLPGSAFEEALKKQSQAAAQKPVY